MKTRIAIFATALAVAFQTATALAVVFTSNTTIAIGVTSYDGQDRRLKNED